MQKQITTVLTGLVGMMALLAALYVLACGLLYLRQDGSIFRPVLNDPTLRRQFASSQIEVLSDNETLQGWWFRTTASPAPLIIYFGGNAEDVLQTASELAELNIADVLTINYRGYGVSTGSPGQEALYRDALAIYDYAIEHRSGDRVFVMGRSLGSAMATRVAASRPVKGAILVTPFDTLAAVAAEHYPIFPVRWLLRHPFRSDVWATRTTAPALVLAAQLDQLIPPAHARRLCDVWAGPTQFHLLAGTGHNNIQSNPQYYSLITQFVSDVTAVE